VGSGKYRAFQEAPGPMVYFALAQRRQDVMHLVVRTSGDARGMLPAVGERLASVDPSVEPRLLTFRDHLQQALSLDRLTTTVVSACGLAALVLATMGVYGVIGDGVRRRTPEIGLRIALGAGPAQVLRLVFGEGLHLTLAGALIGLAAAVILSRVAGAWVHGLPPIDLAVVALVAVALAAVVTAAALLPARRALRVSPTVALRAD
jgi:ABC-type antimicrobial peptide transport system permease subunit